MLKNGIPSYQSLFSNLQKFREKSPRLQRLTLSEKILYAHLHKVSSGEIVRGDTWLKLQPDRVAMQGNFKLK